MSLKEIEKVVGQAMAHANCRRDVRRISVFGSQAHGLASAQSDVDLLVELEPEAKVGLFELHDLEQLLAASLKRNVDLTTPNGLDKAIRKKVLADSLLIYEK